jgi:hypothetical protein
MEEMVAEAKSSCPAGKANGFNEDRSQIAIIGGGFGGDCGAIFL